jgi:hypothetical protein
MPRAPASLRAAAGRSILSWRLSIPAAAAAALSRATPTTTPPTDAVSSCSPSAGGSVARMVNSQWRTPESIGPPHTAGRHGCLLSSSFALSSARRVSSTSLPERLRNAPHPPPPPLMAAISGGARTRMACEGGCGRPGSVSCKASGSARDAGRCGLPMPSRLLSPCQRSAAARARGLFANTSRTTGGGGALESGLLCAGHRLGVRKLRAQQLGQRSCDHLERRQAEGPRHRDRAVLRERAG